MWLNIDNYLNFVINPNLHYMLLCFTRENIIIDKFMVCGTAICHVCQL